jgi:hypothetical protein
MIIALIPFVAQGGSDRTLELRSCEKIKLHKNPRLWVVDYQCVHFSFLEVSPIFHRFSGTARLGRAT